MKLDPKAALRQSTEIYKKWERGLTEDQRDFFGLLMASFFYKDEPDGEKKMKEFVEQLEAQKKTREKK